MDTGVSALPPRFSPVPVSEPESRPVESPRGLPVLMAMNRTGYRMYEGSVPFHVKRRRREAGKRARAARRVTRRHR